MALTPAACHCGGPSSAILYHSKASEITKDSHLYRVGQTRPPDFIGVAQPPLGVRGGQPNQSIARLFFRPYAGSRLVSQCLARFQLMPRRRSAVRTVSSLTCCGVSPRSAQTSATKTSVPVDRAWPNTRGEVCRSSRSLSALAASHCGFMVLGRDDFCCKHPRPSR